MRLWCLHQTYRRMSLTIAWNFWGLYGFPFSVLQLTSFVLDSEFAWTSWMCKRKGAWHFSAVWTFPGYMVAATSTDLIVLQNELWQIENEIKRLVLQTERFPLYLRNIKLKYRLSDWKLARTKIPIQLPVQGYIQAQNNYSIDSDHLNLWFDANWSPVENQLRRDATYKAWAQDDPAYRF